MLERVANRSQGIVIDAVQHGVQFLPLSAIIFPTRDVEQIC
jgi:hypothetical protein